MVWMMLLRRPSIAITHCTESVWKRAEMEKCCMGSAGCAERPCADVDVCAWEEEGNTEDGETDFGCALQYDSDEHTTLRRVNAMCERIMSVLGCNAECVLCVQRPW